MSLEATRSPMIAPCGMNCSLCIGHQRKGRPCSGCFRLDDPHKPESCRSCQICNCGKLAATASGFCYECGTFPCARLKNLDKRYRSKYGMSMIDNLLFIKAKGIESFLRREAKRWACPACTGMLSAHRDQCQRCGAEKPGSLRHYSASR